MVVEKNLNVINKISLGETLGYEYDSPTSSLLLLKNYKYKLYYAEGEIYTETVDLVED